MDEFFGGKDCRFRFSMRDSIMMCILHSAMNKAHEKLKSKEGDFERLIQISRFYELAVMQLEGCLKFVHEETDSCTLERRHEEVLSDLTKIRDRLQGRLEETELTILNKDRELTERLENELKLRQALEMNDRELVSLHANLELERTKSDSLQEFILSNRLSGDESREGEICELKNAVEQQVCNLKQKLEHGRINITSGMRNMEPDYELVDEERNWNIEDRKIEHMSLDIGNLKGTLDLAFGKMQNAIFMSGVEPTEQEWRWTIEKDTISLLIKGFMRDFREIFEPEVKKQEKSIALLSEHWSDLMTEITSLRCELENLGSENDVQVKNIEGHDTFGNHCKSDHTNVQLEEDQEGDGSHSVAKMIKNHESIIRQKSEELNWLKAEILREKKCSLRREKDHDDSKRRIQEVIVRLDNLINWNAKLGETFGDFRGIHKEINFPEKMGVDILADFCKQVDNVSVFHALDEERHDEIVKIKQENEDSNKQIMMLEEAYAVLYKGLMKEFYIELYDFDAENQIKEGICQDFFREMVNECNKNIESYKIEAQMREEIFYIVFSEAVKDFGFTHCSALVETQDASAECNSLEDSTSINESLYNLEGTLREDVCMVIFQEMVKEWNTENLVREEIYRIVSDETVKNIVNTANFASSQYQEMKVLDNFSHDLFPSVESMVKEDVCMVFFREMVKEWKMKVDAYNSESLIREEIYEFVIVEAVKDAYTLFRDSAARDHDNFSEYFLSANKLNERLKVRGKDILIVKLDSLLNGFEVGEDLMLSASSEIKEHNVHLDLVDMEHEELGEPTIFGSLIEKESTFSSVGSKLEKALQQLGLSKTLLRELGYSLGIAVGDPEKFHDPRTPIIGVVCDKKHPFCLPKENEEVEPNSSVSAFSPLMGFSQVFVDFEHTVHEKLGSNMLRFEEVKHQLKPLVEHAALLRKKEKLYRKAFIRRCHNLHKAETEVDLLGDQVDALLGLLEKIHVTLHRHSPVLQQYFGVLDILKLIKKELTVGAAHLPN